MADEGEAARGPGPAEYYPIMGLAIGLIIAGLGFSPGVSLGFTVAGFLLLVLSTSWVSKRSEKWAWGDMKGADAWPAWVMLALSAAGLVLSLWKSMPAVSVPCGIVALLAWLILGPMWDRVNRSR